jgi:hypothetical protein
VKNEDGTSAGQGGPDQDLFQPHLPEVDVIAPEVTAAVFNTARKTASGEAKLPNAGEVDRHVILVTPGRMLMQVPCPPAGSMPPDQVASMEKMLSGAVPRNIAVIAYTDIKAVQADLAKAVPFMGLLLGFAYIGHAVWVFEGHPSALAAGCQDADLLLVDGGMLPYLPEDWPQTAAGVMRQREIYVHDRASFRLKPWQVK